MEKSIQNRQKQSIFQDLCGENRDEIFRLRKERNSAGLTELQEKLIKQTEDTVKSNLFHFTPEQKRNIQRMEVLLSLTAVTLFMVRLSVEWRLLTVFKQ